MYPKDLLQILQVKTLSRDGSLVVLATTIEVGTSIDPVEFGDDPEFGGEIIPGLIISWLSDTSVDGGDNNSFFNETVLISFFPNGFLFEAFFAIISDVVETI